MPDVPELPGAGLRVAVVVPAFEEAAIVAATMDRILEALAALEAHGGCGPSELVVVDDGSTDATGAIARDVAARRTGASAGPAVRVVRHDNNRGLGAALSSGFAAVRGRADAVVVLDCDLSYDVDHIARLLGALEHSGAAIVIASPYAPGGSTRGVPRARALASRAANRLLGALAPGGLRTVTGMVRAYDARFLEQVDLAATGSDANTEVVLAALARGLPVVEVPAHLVWTRPSGASRGSVGWLVRGTLRSLRDAVALRRRLASASRAGQRVVDPGA